MTEEIKENTKRNLNFHQIGKNELKRRKLEVTGGCRGILLTSLSAGKTRESIREFMTILKRFMYESKDLDKKDSNKKEDEDKKEGNKDNEIEKEIKSEIAELSEEQKRFVPIKDICKGISFVRFQNDSDNPCEIVHQILTLTLEEHKFFCRFLSRIIPIDNSCKPYPDDFERCVFPLLQKHFFLKEKNNSNDNAIHVNNCVNNENNIEGSEKQETTKDETKYSTWSCVYTSRSMNTLKKDKVLDILTNHIDKRHKVNLNSPDLTVLVEVNPLICGVSVVKDFYKLLKYNIHRMSNIDATEEKKEKETNKEENEEEEKEEKENEKEEKEENENEEEEKEKNLKNEVD